VGSNPLDWVNSSRAELQPPMDPGSLTWGAASVYGIDVPSNARAGLGDLGQQRIEQPGLAG